MKNRITQKQIVLDHIKKYGSITSMEAIHKYGITRLSDRIFNLRNDGINILTNIVNVDTRYGKEEIAKYTLENEWIKKRAIKYDNSG